MVTVARSMTCRTSSSFPPFISIHGRPVRFLLSPPRSHLWARNGCRPQPHSLGLWRACPLRCNRRNAANWIHFDGRLGPRGAPCFVGIGRSESRVGADGRSSFPADHGRLALSCYDLVPDEMIAAPRSILWPRPCRLYGFALSPTCCIGTIRDSLH